MSGHTPGLWHIRNTSAFGIEIGTDELKVAKAYVGDGHAGYVEEQANARFIVQACNSHDKLLEVASLVVQIKQLSEELGAMSEEEQERRGHLVYAKRAGLNAELWGKAEAAIAKVEGHK